MANTTQDPSVLRSYTDRWGRRLAEGLEPDRRGTDEEPKEGSEEDREPAENRSTSNSSD